MRTRGLLNSDRHYDCIGGVLAFEVIFALSPSDLVQYFTHSVYGDRFPLWICFKKY
ncbi:hypothetical protein [Nostoc linckia]|uniref:hypothetical protein n=1 Tax=Nostoc linckia TaxID=92942 RepID=UPI0015D4AD42|nr:hypothetical protein [Nostoc linckia]